MSLSQDLRQQLFLYYPCHGIYHTLEKKKLAHDLLETLPLCTQTLYFAYGSDCKKKECAEIVKYAIKENNDFIFYKMCTKHKSPQFYEKITKIAAINGNKEKLQHILFMDKSIIDGRYEMIEYVAQGGHLNLLNELIKWIEKGEHGWPELKYHRKFYDCNYNDLAEAAAKGGQITVLKEMIEHGADRFTKFARKAALSNNINTCNYLINTYNVTNFGEIAIFAAKNKNLEVATLIINDMIKRSGKFGKKEFYEIAKGAIKFNHITIIDDMIEKGKFGKDEFYNLICEILWNRNKHSLLEYLFKKVNFTNQELIKLMEKSYRDNKHSNIIYQNSDKNFTKEEFLKILMKFAGRRNRTLINEIIQQSMGYSQSEFDEIMKNCNSSLAKKIIQQSTFFTYTDFEEITIRTIGYNREVKSLNIINDMITFGAKNINEIAMAAGEKGNLRIVNEMIDKGARRFHDIMDSMRYYAKKKELEYKNIINKIASIKNC